ncbi:hypothetical protein [Kitasatospora kifunensis]|uniref:Uncharacterized protein n=1 Tax=Kitasatospora kifunensis TaxID=58351 RepID=A0A7W7QXN9_KITKI|nr:hypothetical protein [Kitasatospora kifunensis]MBB4921443.1 hypothetical protein [Kitasatospora kifunensis]
MNRPPDRPGAAQLRATLQELSAIEEWARRVGGGGGGGPDEYPTPVDPVLCVETMTGSGMHRVVAISSATIPAVRTPLAEAPAAALRSLVRALLDLVGHQEGPAHTKVALTAHGPRIVACRLGEAMPAQPEEAAGPVA